MIMQIYANLCKFMQIYANLCKIMQRKNKLSSKNEEEITLLTLGAGPRG